MNYEFTPEQKWVKDWGTNCNSFLSLYPGFNWFTDPSHQIPGGIAYIENKNTWVACGDPCAPKEYFGALFQDFSKFAEQNKKSIIFIPVDKSTSEVAEKFGYGSVMIGSEPVFDLPNYGHHLKDDTWSSKLRMAQTLQKKGARVREFEAQNLSNAEKKTLEDLTNSWLKSRKMAPLGFLNRVEPWTLSEHKKYFLVEYEQKILAFVAAIPIWATNGWYLIDVIRHHESPAGTVELLLLDSMRLLKQQGAQVVSLGVAPLSNLSKAPNFNEKPELYSTLQYAYENLNHFYDFKSLHQFKDKFKPSRYETALLLYYPADLNFRQVKGLLDAFVPGGVGVALYSFALKKLQKYNLLRTLYKIFDFNAITLFRQDQKPWFTGILLSALSAFFFFGPKDQFLAVTAFSASQFWDRPVASILIPQFLHWTSSHLALNLILITLFTGTLECAFGSTVALICFFLPSMLANATTALLLSPLTLSIFNEKDIGASLGAFGSLGALLFFARRRIFLLVLACAGVAFACYSQNSFLQLNHLVALAFGAIFAKLLVK